MSTCDSPRALQKQAARTLDDIPDEILIYILWFLDVDALLSTAKVRAIPPKTSSKLSEALR